MPDISNAVPTSELPSTKKLIRSTIIALVIATVLLFTVVLPAEYGIDPTGIGSAIGLTEMGRIKTSLAKEAAAEKEAAATATTSTADVPSAVPTTPISTTPTTTMSTTTTAPAATVSGSQPRSDKVTVVLEPDEGREIKLSMREGARVSFSWSTDRGVVNYDTHADSKVPKRDYYGYEKGSAVKSKEGELVAAFDGWHGWFWRNRGKERLTVTLQTNGDYQEIKEPE